MLNSKKNPIFHTDPAEQTLCCTFLSAESLETGKFILIYLFKLKILAVLRGVCLLSAPIHLSQLWLEGKPGEDLKIITIQEISPFQMSLFFVPN